MKKQLLTAITLASMACLAQAQSSVKVQGTMDEGVASIRMAGDKAAATQSVSGGMTTPWFGFAGTEDLGGGLKASFALDGFFNNANGASGRGIPGDTLFSRDANVSLSGGFGTVLLGRGLAPNFLPTVIFNPFGDSFTYSPLVLHANVPLFNGTGWSATSPSDTGWNNEVIYSTPNFGGLSANLHYQIGGIAGQSKSNIGGNFLYFAGPLALTGFVEQDQLPNPVTSTAYSVTKNDWMIGGSYDLSVVKFYATTGSAKASGSSISTKTNSVGASIPAGGGSIMADYASTKVDAGKTRQTATIGYDYKLSARTDVYANYMNDKITTYATGDSYGVGIRHKF